MILIIINGTKNHVKLQEISKIFLTLKYLVCEKKIQINLKNFFASTVTIKKTHFNLRTP